MSEKKKAKRKPKCNFLKEFLKGKPCDKYCDYYNTCTRRGNKKWERFMNGEW